MNAEPREIEWVVDYFPAGYRGPFRPGVRFMAREGTGDIIGAFRISRAEFAELVVEVGPGLRCIRDTRAVRPRLEVLR